MSPAVSPSGAAAKRQRALPAEARREASPPATNPEWMPHAEDAGGRDGLVDWMQRVVLPNCGLSMRACLAFQRMLLTSWPELRVTVYYRTIRDAWNSGRVDLVREMIEALAAEQAEGDQAQ